MSLAAFVSAVLALLLAPGPTNTLMGVAGAESGMRHVLRLIPAELAGYLAMVIPLAFLGAQAMARWPAASAALTIAASIWVLFLAYRLWASTGAAHGEASVTARRILATTLLNPKALVFGFVLLPAPSTEQFLPRLVLFCLAVAATAFAWGVAGQLVRSLGAAGKTRLRIIQRVASVWLGAVSVMLLAGVVRA